MVTTVVKLLFELLGPRVIGQGLIGNCTCGFFSAIPEVEGEGKDGEEVRIKLLSAAQVDNLVANNHEHELAERVSRFWMRSFKSMKLSREPVLYWNPLTWYLDTYPSKWCRVSVVVQFQSSINHPDTNGWRGGSNLAATKSRVALSFGLRAILRNSKWSGIFWHRWMEKSSLAWKVILEAVW